MNSVTGRALKMSTHAPIVPTPVVDVKVESPSPEKKEEAVGSVAPPTSPVSKPKKEKKKREHKPSGKSKPNPWLEHVKQFRKAHPELKFKYVLKQAKATYKKPVKPES